MTAASQYCLLLEKDMGHQATRDRPRRKKTFCRCAFQTMTHNADDASVSKRQRTSATSSSSTTTTDTQSTSSTSTADSTSSTSSTTDEQQAFIASIKDIHDATNELNQIEEEKVTLANVIKELRRDNNNDTDSLSRKLIRRYIIQNDWHSAMIKRDNCVLHTVGYKQHTYKHSKKDMTL